MIIYTIYKSVNKINGKVYIGFDSNWPNRLKDHECNYQNKAKKNSKFYCAIRKHGWDNFEWNIIYQSLDGNHCLNVMESYFIKEHNSYNNGYNMTLGGEGSLGRIPHNKGKKMTPMKLETKIKISKSMTGKLRTKEHRDNLSKSCSGNKNRNKKLKTPDGIFDSATEAAIYYNVNRNTMYSRIYDNTNLFQYIK